MAGSLLLLQRYNLGFDNSKQRFVQKRSSIPNLASLRVQALEVYFRSVFLSLDYEFSKSCPTLRASETSVLTMELEFKDDSIFILKLSYRSICIFSCALNSYF